MAAVVGEALRKLQPVSLWAGDGVVHFQVNRRNNGRLLPLELQAELAGRTSTMFRFSRCESRGGGGGWKGRDL